MLRWGRGARPAAKLRWLVQCRRLVVLDSSRFQQIISNEGCALRNSAYAGDPLATISFARRGLSLETLARRLLERLYDNHATQDAEYDGDGQRNLGQAKFDWIFMGRRVELKTSQLCFDKGLNSWKVVFYKVKLARDGCRAEQPFDDLYLLIYAPDGFFLVKHDLKTGVTKTGSRTATLGHNIKVTSKRGQICWKEALHIILDKLTLRGGCVVVSYVPKSDPLVQTLYAEVLNKAYHAKCKFYDGIPLFTLNSVIRAHRIQEIAYQLDQLENPDSVFRSAKGEVTPYGYTRGGSNAAVDWIRDKVRVEVKSSTLCIRARDNRWFCRFSGIREGSNDDGTNPYFDELWLAIYHPGGIDFFKHWNWRDTLSTCGQATCALGKLLIVTAGAQSDGPSDAFKSIKAQLESRGAEHYVALRWTSECRQA
ncbi:GUSB [Symbiodinium sp. CCMP2592]|nr:GUSB [Symbiodinium sp. CCMP2592]